MPLLDTRLFFIVVNLSSPSNFSPFTHKSGTKIYHWKAINDYSPLILPNELTVMGFDSGIGPLHPLVVSLATRFSGCVPTAASHSFDTTSVLCCQRYCVAKVVCVMEWILHNKCYSKEVKVAVVVVVIGVGVCTVTDVKVNAKAPIQALSLLVFDPFIDYYLSGRLISDYMKTISSGVIIFILSSCSLAVFCNISRYLCIGRFSAVSFQYDFSFGNTAFHQETLGNVKMAIKSTKKLCAVQSDRFEEFFAPELDKHGYQALFKKKTSEDNVALIVVLGASLVTKVLIILESANTHVNVQHELKDVKLWQDRQCPHALLAIGKVDPMHQDLAVDRHEILRLVNKIEIKVHLLIARVEHKKNLVLEFAEMGNRVHEFATSGMRHPKRKKICSNSEELVGELKGLGYVAETNLRMRNEKTISKYNVVIEIEKCIVNFLMSSS
ncbi:hypothetical protein L2E82_02743 [Cichorium intybus]|uniref:Uncharacterized protein n=1 Tax=Cichorium intybus TaxID=13427 RepID=A0ACB9H357_CICIN|nr:hypothetical protein L2E82_02743 [Cichorium intybus]